ncbi:hypothetical protein DPN68_12920 [Flavobacterium tibetense]|uniref:Uncharacterized protein n=1 Tax=Flavobacterium tibetense TaxID=2233533 RepID=A0A365NYL1_9FLAO|nr:hypothetical protein DPN68_12920 [Flavobacterium tibetense]
MATIKTETVTKSKTLEKLLLDHLEDFEPSGGGGGDHNLPDFELYAIDYLEFAEKRLNNIEKYKDDIDELINCVAHLKRAVDCQLDTFFHSVGLYKTIQDRNLKFEKKLDFLNGIGVFSSRSLNRLNTLRNKMEHHYEIPKISDIELYYDLVSAFIAVIQGLIFLLGFHREVDFSINIEDNNFGDFQSEYDDKKLEIRIKWNLKKSDKKNELVAKLDELDDFIYFFKVHILLVQLDTFANWKHIYDKIKLTKNDKKNGSH